MQKSHRIAKPVALLFLISLSTLLLGCDTAEESSDVTAPSTVRGPLDIYYSVQTSETEGVSTGDTPFKASAIHFYDEYIVVEGADGSGRIFPVQKINFFRWKKK